MQSAPSEVSPTYAGRSESRSIELIRTVVGPLLLMGLTPPAIFVLWGTCAFLNGELSRLLTAEGWRVNGANFPLPSLKAAAILGAFVAMELVLLLILPGKTHYGPVTPAGDRPAYRKNGVLAYFVTHALLAAGAFAGLYHPSIAYDHFGEILATLCAFALLFCALLYWKGSRSPSSGDAGRSGNIIWDYYWGVELHPRIGPVNLKQLINCRIGMMGWSVVLLSFAAQQYEDIGRVTTSMLVCVALQLVYIIKFFIWETGYFGSLDIMHDRFGYYICWGVLCWIPGAYTITGQFLVKHPHDLRPAYAWGLFLFGVASIWANYDADAQRQRVRETGGQTTVWGRPPELIHAEYKTADGKTHKSLLLASGWWGLSRHFHYVTEICLALAWSMAAGFGYLLPYFYVIFLSVLLFDRAGRDDLRCRNKYGRFWDQYCQKARYRIVPYVY